MGLGVQEGVHRPEVKKKGEGPSALSVSEGIKRMEEKGGQWPRDEIRLVVKKVA
jgi:hypothetical protein